MTCVGGIMSKQTTTAIFVAAILVIGIGIGVGAFQHQSSPSTGSVEKITLGAEASLLTAAVWVAEEKGYFQESGIEVEIKQFDSGRLSFLAMLAGEGVDISTVAPTPIMFNSFERQDFSILATFVYSEEDVKVIARKDKGINDAADLVGKKVGTPAGTTGQFFLSAFLTANALADSDVEMVDIAPASLPAALNDGQVDAIVIWEPHGYNAKTLLGNRGTTLPSSGVYGETFNFMVMNDFARDKPEASDRFLKAIDKATTFIKHNKEASQTIVATRLGLDKVVMTALWDDFQFAISLNQSLILTLEDEARWAVRNALVDAEEAPNYLPYIHMDTLESVRPDAMTIIR